MTGQKHDTEKLRLDLLPVEVLEEVAKVLQHGANKYGDYNWSKGIAYHRCYGAILRHIFAWWRKEDNDKETNLNHLAHLICEAMFLLAYQLRGMDNYDDRHRS